MIKVVRQLSRAVNFLWVIFRTALDGAIGQDRPRTDTERSSWLHRWSREGTRALNVKISSTGNLPSTGLIVSNHLGYLDILVLSALFPACFVSKDDVESWPLVGWLTKIAGTIFVNRQSRADSTRVNSEVVCKLQAGIPVVIFPEGTSTDGSQVLPFHASLLQSAITANVPITPIHIAYYVPDGDASTEVCYWGDMVFGPHLLGLAGTSEIQATINIGLPQMFTDRKTAAIESRNSVIELGMQVAGVEH